MKPPRFNKLALDQIRYTANRMTTFTRHDIPGDFPKHQLRAAMQFLIYGGFLRVVTRKAGRSPEVYAKV
jgi:hypothetical protein